MPTNGQYAVGELVTASDANTVFSRGNRNAIINGDFFVNQRAFTNSGSGALDAYGLDRWKIVSSGGGTWTPQTFTPGNAISGYEPATFSRIVTSGQSGSSVYSILAQPVEDVRTFAGQTTTLSFWAKANSGTPKIAVELAQVFGSGGSPSAAANYYAGQITLSTSWARYTLQIAVPSITGKTIGTTANTSYVALQLWVSAGSSFNTRTGSLGIQTNTFDIWGVQWETGQVATPFQIPDRADQLAECMRYFEKSTGYYIISGAYGTGGYVNVFMKVRKRVTPTIGALDAGTTLDGTSQDYFGVGKSGVASWVLVSWEASAEL